MLLTIDIGNTNITLGIWDGQQWRQHWRLRTVLESTRDEYGLTLTGLLREAGLDNSIDSIVMSSVVPVLTDTFTAACQAYIGQEALQVTIELDLGIRILTDAPAAVGVDRIANAVAAHTLFPGPSITIDMGTATKFDVVSGRGELIGGVIAPGLQLTADALAARAAQLSQVALQAPPQTIGRNTIHAMQSGLVFGYVCLIEGIIRRITTELSAQEQAVCVLGTGGLIHLISQYTEMIDYVDPWLTLTGLRIIHDRVKG